ncbi:uncharacterized protein P884DRAFT_204248, partial [Thermothelomyces heterothallicus CBS 202.75]|uniref:uncharacterized protein n=1 Tax=Thermothelomyces heterothallicus CBS 202.75 TaxID=1149848 RepID=UPI00374225D0
MDDIAHHSFGHDFTQLVFHASYRAFQLEEAAKSIGLKLDPKKTEILYVPPSGRGSKTRIPPIHSRKITMPSGTLQAKSKIKWLGVGLDSKLSLSGHLESRLPKAANLAGLAARINQVCRGLPTPSTRALYITAAVPIVTYGLSALFPGLTRQGRRG